MAYGKYILSAVIYEQLQNIRGVGPAIVENTIKSRNINGQFESMDELNNVSYIGMATIEAMRPNITIS
ncbi:ComEA family DNA-binding protein [Salibacterium halotolerans]|uniref:ComEA family DNA-binding protein n=1 Tax=Salibacterium halotolerans TaxID=1884432 RepID=UPI000B836A1E|nr:helix-hairpin-helix domain-containing protein [Salibacterium halotolerans]